MLDPSTLTIHIVYSRLTKYNQLPFLLYAYAIRIWHKIHPANDCWYLQSNLDTLFSYVNHWSPLYWYQYMRTLRVHPKIAAHTYSLRGSTLTEVIRECDLSSVISFVLSSSLNCHRISTGAGYRLEIINRCLGRVGKPSPAKLFRPLLKWNSQACLHI